MEMFEEADEAKKLQSNSKPSSNVVKTSQFVKGIRNWYNACDARGYTPAERINMMQDFYDVLTHDVDFSEYRPPSTHVKGIPIIMYEGILQNISLKIAMHRMAKNRRYNQHSVSTLAVENFFGDLTAMDFSGLGCPKSTDIMKLMGHVIQLNHHRMDPTWYLRYLYAMYN